MIVSLITLASCGGGSGGGSSKSTTVNPQTEEQRTPDSTQVDLLDSMIDVKVTITPNEILFRESKVSKARGRSIECQTQVKGGDIYSYEVRGDKLDVIMDGQKITMDRLNESTGLRGAWAWKGYEDGIYTIRSFSFINDARLIIKKHCEN